MSSTIRRTAAIAVAAIAASSGISCSSQDVADKAAEKIAEAAGGDGTDVSIDSETGEVKVDTEDGSFSMGTTELPESWPSEIPLPDDYTLSFAMESAAAEGATSNITGTVPGSASSTFDQIVGEFGAGGWTETMKTTSSSGDGTVSTASFENSDWTVMFNVSETGDETTFSYTVVPTSS